MKLTYVDAALIHWPTTTNSGSAEPSCQNNKPSYNSTECRLQTWRAMQVILASGKCRSVGVSNYNVSQASARKVPAQASADPQWHGGTLAFELGTVDVQPHRALP